MLLLNVRARYAIVAIVGPSSIARPVGIARTWAALAREQGGGLCPIGQPKNIEVPFISDNVGYCQYQAFFCPSACD